VTFMADATGSSRYEGLSDVTPTNQFFGFTMPLNVVSGWFRESVFGFGYIGSSMGNIPHTGMDGFGNPVHFGTFSDSNRAFLLAMGMPLIQGATNLYFGASFRYITERWSGISGASANGYDFTAGVIYNVDTLSFGAVLEKGARMTWATGRTDRGPTTARFGVSNIFALRELMDLTGAMDLVQRQQEPLELNLGVQFGVRDVHMADNFEVRGIFLRGGIAGYAIENRHNASSTINQNITYTLGLGTEFLIMGRYLQIDFSYGMGNIFDEGAKISLNFYF
ncbi:MAG: hypothetical protein FWC85_01645, partial [Elusimicrobia bacterium]|nr:hypothetical protein [Elusimicrobiota bacterium]